MCVSLIFSVAYALLAWLRTITEMALSALRKWMAASRIRDTNPGHGDLFHLMALPVKLGKRVSFQARESGALRSEDCFPEANNKPALMLLGTYSGGKRAQRTKQDVSAQTSTIQESLQSDSAQPGWLCAQAPRRHMRTSAVNGFVETRTQ